MRAILVRVGADGTNGGGKWLAPVDPESGRFVYIPIPENSAAFHPECERRFDEADAPFRYDFAPMLVNSDGASDFPALLATFRGVRRSTWPARFSSAFRSRRTPLPAFVADEIARVFDRKRAKAKQETLARSYVDALPYPPNNPDSDREKTLMKLRANGAHRTTKCKTLRGGESEKSEFDSPCRACKP